MQKFFWLFLIFALVAANLTIRTETVPAMIQRVEKTSVLVDSHGYGTGVLVARRDDDGRFTDYVWTAGHVVLESEKNPVVVTNILVWIAGNPHKATVVAYEFNPHTIDIALLQLVERDVVKDSTVFYDGAPPMPGTPIYHVGNFYGTNMPMSVSAGIISAVGRTDHFGEQDQTSIPTYPGSSGGGVYLSDGRCIGLTDARGEESIGLIVPVREMRVWAQAHRLERYLDLPHYPVPQGW